MPWFYEKIKNKNKNCTIYEGPVLLPNVSTPPRIGGKTVVPLCAPLRQLENATTTTKLSLVSACSPLTYPPGFPFFRLHEAYTMLRAISAISANGMLIALSFCIYSVSRFFIFFGPFQRQPREGEVGIKTEIYVAKLWRRGSRGGARKR